MLVLSRRRGESIIVGDDIEIRILEVHGGQVKIGVQAPSCHTVHRKEVYLAIRQKNGGRPLVRADQPSPPSRRPYSGYHSGGNGEHGGSWARRNAGGQTPR